MSNKHERVFRVVFLVCCWMGGWAQALAADEIHWTVTGPTSVTVDWKGPETEIHYGLTSAYGKTVAARQPSPLPFSSSGPFWEARLTGLAEDTVYHYAIGDGPDQTFRTPPPRGTSGFTVAVEGDIADSARRWRMGVVQGLIAAGPPAFVLAVGDLTYGNKYGQDAVDQHFNDVMVWSRYAAYMPAWGNHEWDKPYDPATGTGDDLRNYKGRFDFPNPQTSPGSPAVSCCGEDWYWFDFGNTRFIAYPEPWKGAWVDWNVKADALMDEAQADPAIAFIVTYGHRPAYSSGHHPGSSTLKGYLDALGAGHSKHVLNLNGHSHNYERTYPQSGVVHVTAGIGGANLGQDGSCLWLTCIQPSWSAFRAMHHGFLRLRFLSDRIEGEAICGPPGGKTSNINDITCDQGTIMDRFTVISREAPNLIGNPSFEEDLSGWRSYGGSTIERVSGGFAGAFSAQVTGPASTATFGINDHPNWILATPAPGTRYRAAAWVQSAGSTGRAKLRIREFNNGVLVRSTYSPAVVLSPTWQLLLLELVAQNSGSTIDIQVLDTPVTVSEVFLVDDISIRIIP